MDTPTSPVTLAELARATDDLPLAVNDNDKNDGAPSALMTSPGAVGSASLPSSAGLAPTEADIATLTAQYRKALDGLFEAYRFGQMLMKVRASLTRETGSYGQPAAGSGLKGWLDEHCPEINYKTALRFLSIAENTHRALAAQGAAPSEGDQSANQPSLQTSAPSEAEVRAFLAGKSQRQVLARGGSREGAGRPRKNWAEALGTSPEAAMARLDEALGPLNELIVVKQTHRLLSETDLETLRAAIDLLHERVHYEA